MPVRVADACIRLLEQGAQAVVSASSRERWPGHFSGNVQVAVGDCAASRNRPGAPGHWRMGAMANGHRQGCESCAKVERLEARSIPDVPFGEFGATAPGTRPVACSTPPSEQLFLSALDVPRTGVSAGNGTRPLDPCRRFGPPNCADGIRISESMSSASVEAACLNFHRNMTPDKRARSGTSARKDAHSVRQPPAAIRRAPATLAGLPGKRGNSTRLNESRCARRAQMRSRW